MVQVDLLPCTPGHTLGDLQFFSFLVVYSPPPGMQTTSSPGRFSLALGAPAPKAREKRPGDEVGMQKETIPHPRAPDRHHVSFLGGTSF